MNNIRVMVLLLLVSCIKSPDRWDGIPANRTCGLKSPTSETTCIADDKVYKCIRDDNRMLCSRDTVEIKCTNIVNVETVCPASVKP